MTAAHAASDEVPASSRSRFIAAALELFLEHGFSGTSLQMIGDQLGVSKAAVYYHFRTKDELLAAVVGPMLDDLRTVIEDVEAVPRESTRRKQGLEAYIDYLISHRREISWLSRDVSAISHPVVWEPAQALTKRVDSILVTSVDDPVSHVWVAGLTQALTGAVLSDNELSDDDLKVELGHMGDVLIRGLLAARRRVGA